jgi:hypothetical protein
VGTVTPTLALPPPSVTGNTATGQVGNVGASITVALTGVQATGYVGNVSVPGASGPVNFRVTMRFPPLMHPKLRQI